MVFPFERRNSRWWHLANATLRQAVLRGATRSFADNVVVNEYPKSGGTWFSQMLSEALEIPYPRNRFPMIRSCLMQCHVLNPMGMRNVVIVWRDGRDVMVSFYHHLLLGHEYGPEEVPMSNARKLRISNPVDVRHNLPRFIQAIMRTEIGPSFNWPQFVDRWHDRPGVLETRYEDLLIDPAGEVCRIAVALSGKAPSHDQIDSIVKRYSFKEQAGRDRGEESRGKFLRKGVAGDWNNFFSPEAIEVFKRYAGAQLNRLGYPAID